MESRFTHDDVIAAAQWVREQAPRLPHPQRHAAMMMARLFEGVDIGPNIHPEFGDVGGQVFISIPVFWSATLLGAVDVRIFRNMESVFGDEWKAVGVHSEYNQTEPPTAEELVKDIEPGEVLSFPSPDIGLGDPNEDKIEGERRQDQTGEVWVKLDDMSIGGMVCIAHEDGSDEHVITQDTWDGWEEQEYAG